MSVQTTVSGDAAGYIVEMHDGDTFHSFGAMAHELMERFRAEFGRVFNRAPDDAEAAPIVAVATEAA